VSASRSRTRPSRPAHLPSRVPLRLLVGLQLYVLLSPSIAPMNGTHQTLRQQTRRTLISEPFSDPIEHMANQLALELFDVDDFLSFDLDFEIPPANTQHHGGPYNAASSPTTTTTPQFFSSSKTSSSSFRKKKNTLSQIPEED